jgi:hypothetical protein
MADVLAHFTVLSRKDPANFHVRCQFCHSEFHASKARLKCHLGHQRNSGIKHCLAVPPQVRDAFHEVSDKKRKQRSPTKSTSSSMSSDAALSQLSLPAAFQQDHRKEADEKWAKFCYTEGIPFSKFESPWLQEAIKATVAAGPSYKLPNPKKLGGTLLDQNVQAVREKLRSTLFRNVAKTGITMRNSSRSLQSLTN